VTGLISGLRCGSDARPRAKYLSCTRARIREIRMQLSPRRDLAQQKLRQSSLPAKASTINSLLRETEHLGMFMGHGKSTGAVCDLNAFEEWVIVEPASGSQARLGWGVDLVTPEYEAAWKRDIARQLLFGDVVLRKIFSRSPRPLLAITILSHDRRSLIDRQRHII